ncbi:hypothetical protein [Phenylobacterium sp.]|uniref:hypothetical protein n=1 Tax=Phenylobacterium sp. TaxID=1871053 RepID=UPI00395FF228
MAKKPTQPKPAPEAEKVAGGAAPSGAPTSPAAQELQATSGAEAPGGAAPVPADAASVRISETAGEAGGDSTAAQASGGAAAPVSAGPAEGELEAEARLMADLGGEVWAGLPATVRQDLAGLVHSLHEHTAATVAKIRAIAAEATDPELVEVEVRSRDGKPFRRAGLAFSGAFQPYRVTPAQLAAIQADPGLVLKEPA